MQNRVPAHGVLKVWVRRSPQLTSLARSIGVAAASRRVRRRRRGGRLGEARHRDFDTDDRFDD
jgi:hypothetical protein